MNAFRLPRVTATAAAERAVADLVAKRGRLMFVQSGGCCDGSAPMCFDFGEFLTGTQDILVGEITGCPVYLDQRQLDAWPHTDLVLDVEPGYADGFSLAAGPDLHFVTRYEPPTTTDQETRQP